MVVICITKYCSIRCKVIISNFISVNFEIDITGGGQNVHDTNTFVRQCRLSGVLTLDKQKLSLNLFLFIN